MMTFISCRRLMSNFGVLFDAKTACGRHDGGIYFVMFDRLFTIFEATIRLPSWERYAWRRISAQFIKDSSISPRIMRYLRLHEHAFEPLRHSLQGLLENCFKGFVIRLHCLSFFSGLFFRFFQAINICKELLYFSVTRFRLMKCAAVFLWDCNECRSKIILCWNIKSHRWFIHRWCGVATPPGVT